jgi:opacity protein-like surface antigen
MTIITRLCLTSLSIASGFGYAVSPVDGFYAGLMVGGSYINTLKFNTNNRATINVGSLAYKTGIDGSTQVGYRFCDNVRVEGEINVDINRLQLLKMNGLTLKVHQTPASASNPFNTTTVSGHTSFEAVFANLFYDFFYEDSLIKWVPYAGLGIGYASLQNKHHLSNAGVAIDGSFSETKTAPIGQAILGISYYIRDNFSLGLDCRYLTTNKIKYLTGKINAETVNLTLNYGFY